MIFFIFVFFVYTLCFEPNNSFIEIIKEGKGDLGVTYLIGKNICIAKEEDEHKLTLLYFYSNKNIKNLQDYVSYRRVKNYLLRAINVPLKSEYIIWKERGNAWTIGAAFQHHIGHYFDSYVQLYHSLFNNNVPQIDYLLHLNIDPKSEFEWSVGLYNILLRFYHNRNPIKHIFRDKLSRLLPICFDKLYIIGNYDYPRFFMPFSYKSRKIFRDKTLNYLNIKTRVKKGRIGIINRKKKRILKYDLIYKYLNEINQEYDIIYFEDLNLVDQIKWINSYSFLIIMHGTVFTNLIWCLDRIGLIEISHRGYYSNYAYYGIYYNFVYYRLFSQDEMEYADHEISIKCMKIHQYSDVKKLVLKEFIYLFNLISKKLIV